MFSLLNTFVNKKYCPTRSNAEVVSRIDPEIGTPENDKKGKG